MRSARRASAALAAFLLAACAAAPPAPAPTAAPPAARDVFLLLPDVDGRVGRVTVSNEAGAVNLEAAGQATEVGDARTAPGAPRTLTREEIEALFGPALAAAPAPPLHFLLYFEAGAAELAPASREELPRVVEAIRARASADTSVIGHTDTVGEKGRNYALALQRAEMVAARLVAAGVDPAILETGSHGEENLLVPTADEVAEPRNRRVEVTVR